MWQLKTQTLWLWQIQFSALVNIFIIRVLEIRSTHPTDRYEKLLLGSKMGIFWMIVGWMFIAGQLWFTIEASKRAIIYMYSILLSELKIKKKKFKVQTVYIYLSILSAIFLFFLTTGFRRKPTTNTASSRISIWIRFSGIKLTKRCSGSSNPNTSSCIFSCD